MRFQTEPVAGPGSEPAAGLGSEAVAGSGSEPVAATVGEPVAGPSGSGTVVLELGPGAGALVLHTPAELNGAEIEISLTGVVGRRTHSMVRPRHVAGGTRYAAVYPGLPPGDYTVWRDDGTAAATVTVIGGNATTARWSAS